MLHKIKIHSDIEGLKRRKSAETVKTNSSVAVTSAPVTAVGGEKYINNANNRFAPGEYNFGKKF